MSAHLHHPDRQCVREDPPTSSDNRTAAAGIAKGESTARLSRELNLDRKHLGELRQHIQTNFYETLPGELMTGTAFEADELYHNAGEKSTPHPDPADPPRRRANKQIDFEYPAGQLMRCNDWCVDLFASVSDAGLDTDDTH